MTNAEVRDLLIRARARIERGWTQGAMARDGNADFIIVPTTAPEATCWCIAGALLADATLGTANCGAAYTALLDAHKSLNGDKQNSTLSIWNDAPERTQADVLALFDKAIERVEVRAPNQNDGEIMTNWIKTSERLPIGADGDHRGEVLIANSGRAAFAASVSRAGGWDYWRPITPDDYAPKERKLHPAWRELKADSWDGKERMLVAFVKGNETPSLNSLEGDAKTATEYGYTHWQPMPPIWEDEK